MAFNAPSQAANKSKGAPDGKSAPEAKAEKPKTSRAAGNVPWTWGTTMRVVVSLLAIVHLTAVFSAPWAVQLRDLLVPNIPPGTVIRDRASGRPIPLEQLSPRDYPPMRPELPLLLADNRFFRNYANLLFINHGYDFFTPDPSVSHVLRYTIYNARNEEIAKGTFPDRSEQRPRLFYHRHMMLVDQSSLEEFGPLRWETRIAKTLLDKHDGDRIEMKFYVHHLLTPDEVKAGKALTDETSYELVGQMQQRRGEELPALPTQSSAPVMQATIQIPGAAQ